MLSSSPNQPGETSMQLISFIDYLAKWPEVYAIEDHTALTIANLLVTETPRHLYFLTKAIPSVPL